MSGYLVNLGFSDGLFSYHFSFFFFAPVQTLAFFFELAQPLVFFFVFAIVPPWIWKFI